MEDLRWPTYKTRDTVLEAAVPAEGRGSVRVRDADGREYLDCVGGIGCAPLGHAHPGWVDAIARQLGTLASASNSYRTGPQQQLAQRLIDLFPISDARSFLCTTGTESTEAGIKLAVKATGRDVIIAFERAFHGRSLGALSLTANPNYRQPFINCLGEGHEDRFADMKVVRAPFGDANAVDALMRKHEGRVAAVFIEPIQGEAGVFPATKEFLLQLRQLCDEHGALLGIDEIQSGCGRTGHFTAWESIVGDAAEPDLLWIAKAFGGGFPVAACIARRSLAEAMQPGSHGTTYGGNPVACAAALATLRIIEEEGLLEKAAAQLPTLRAIAEADPIPEVTEIRGLGAMIGVQIGAPEDQRAAPLGQAMPDEGVLVTVCGGHTVRSLLPYHAGEAELREFWAALRKSLEVTA